MESVPLQERLPRSEKSLFGISPELDATLVDFAYLADRHKEFHPANSGDISQVLSPETAEAVRQKFAGNESEWFEISHIQDLARIRNDGRRGYRGEGITSERYYEELKPMASRLMLITRTGADVPSLRSTIEAGEEGKLLNILEVDNTARKVRVVYGNKEYGSIPSIETHVHLVSNGMSIAEGMSNPSTVHAHPFNIVTLGRDKRIKGDQTLFNAAIYTQTEGINRNHDRLIGVSEYYPSGSADLVGNSLDALKQNGMVLWMNHGFTVRHENIRRGYTLMAYADDNARAALDSLRNGSIGLPDREVNPFLKTTGLESAYNTLFRKRRRTKS